MGAYILLCLFVAFPLVASQAGSNDDLQWDIRCHRESEKAIILSWYPLQVPESKILFYNVSCQLDDYYWLNFTTTDFTHNIPVIAGEKFVASVTPVIEERNGFNYTGVPATIEIIESTATADEAPLNVTLSRESDDEVLLLWDPPRPSISTDYIYSVICHADSIDDWMEIIVNATAVLIIVQSEYHSVKAKVASIANSVKSDYIWANWLNVNPSSILPRWIAIERTISSEIFSGPSVHYLPPITGYNGSDQSVPSNVTLVQVDFNDAILSWNPPIMEEEEILGYKVLYTTGQTPNIMDIGNVTRFSISFDNDSSAIEASVATTIEKNINPQMCHFSESVRIETSNTEGETEEWKKIRKT